MKAPKKRGKTTARAKSAGGLSEMRISALTLAALSVLSAALSLYLSRDSFFTNDEVGFFVLDGAYGVGTYLDPFIGHLIVLPRAVYGLIFRIFGPDYLPIRLLTAVSIVGLAWAVFAYAAQRIRPFAALSPAVIMLFFGADPLHFTYGNAIVVLPAVALGIGAMALLYAPSQKRDIAACVLLVAAILCYSQALPFLLGALVLIALAPEWRRRAWVVLVPIGIYGVWWLWSLGAETSSAGQTNADLTTLLSLPSVMFALLGFTLDGVTGLYFREPWIAPDPGPALALAGIALVCWVGSRRGWRPLLPSIAALLGMLALVGLIMAKYDPETLSAVSFSRIARYLFPLGAASLLVATDLLTTARIDARWLRWIGAFTAISLAGSLLALSRPFTTWSGIPAIVLAGSADQARGETNGLVAKLLVWSPERDARAKDLADQPLDGRALTRAIDRFGPPAANYNWMGGWDPGRRRWMDERIVEYLGIAPEPVPRALRVRECRTVQAPSKGLLKVLLPRGGAVVRVLNGSGPLRLSRIGAGPGTPVGSARSRGPFLLRIPDDGAPADVFWTLRADADAVEVCRLPERVPLGSREGVDAR